MYKMKYCEGLFFNMLTYCKILQIGQAILIVFAPLRGK